MQETEEEIVIAADRLKNIFATGPDVISEAVRGLCTNDPEPAETMFRSGDGVTNKPSGRGVPSWSDGFGKLTARSRSSQVVSEDNLQPNPIYRTSSFVDNSASCLPEELEEHLRTCRCTCNHMGYGNYQVRKIR